MISDLQLLFKLADMGKETQVIIHSMFTRTDYIDLLIRPPI